MSTKLPDPDTLIQKMSDELGQLLEKKSLHDPLMVGIHTGGAWVAEKLHGLLDINKPLASLDISFYRDDFSRIGMNPEVKPSQLPPQVEGDHIILIDDVLFTGRTIRAAMNEIFDYGRPASIILACLIERSGRELPVHPDVVGEVLKLSDREHVKLIGPEPLQLELKNTG